MAFHEKINELYRVYYNDKLNLESNKEIIPLMGIIGGRQILFVGQNPGIPFQKDHITLFENFLNLDYDSQQETFKKSWKNSLFIKFIVSVCKNLDLNFNDISVTNIAKYWTRGNTKPNITDMDQKLLACEIKLIDPAIVVFLSKWAYNNFNYKNDVGARCFAFDHPCSHYYSDKYVKQIAKELREFI